MVNIEERFKKPEVEKPAPNVNKLTIPSFEKEADSDEVREHKKSMFRIVVSVELNHLVFYCQKKLSSPFKFDSNFKQFPNTPIFSSSSVGFVSV